MIRRMYVKALSNGFLIEMNDHDYFETEVAFPDWDQTVAYIAANPLEVRTKTSGDVVSPIEAIN